MKERLKQIYRAITGRDDFQYTSYAQSGEDRIIDLLRRKLQLEEFNYLEIGACNGVHHSNTCLFYKMGFRGVLVEANPMLLDRLAQTRPCDQIIHSGVVPSNMADSSSLNFYVMNSNAMGTFSESQAKALQQKGYRVEQTISVPVTTLDKILSTHVPSPLHLLSLDVEGLDESILMDADFRANPPTIICVESLTHSREKNDLIQCRLKSLGYEPVADTIINTIFVKGEEWHSECLVG